MDIPRIGMVFAQYLTRILVTIQEGGCSSVTIPVCSCHAWQVGWL